MREKIVIIGASGQVGLALCRHLQRADRTFVALGPGEIDVTAPQAAEQLVAFQPSAVINAAAWTDVRRAEDAQRRAAVWAVNCTGPGRIARGCKEFGIPFVHISTDYVFDGRQSRPYQETDAANPLQAYGASKLDGEQAVREAYPHALIARTSTVYGDRPEGPPHYVDAILAQARTHGALEVVRLPVSSPSYTPDIAAALLALLDAAAHGIVHVVNRGTASRLELATEAVRLAGLDLRVGERPEPADDLERPAYSALDTACYTRWTGRSMRPWQEALSDYIKGQAR